jgi:hypothetical protein
VLATGFHLTGQIQNVVKFLGIEFNTKIYIKLFRKYFFPKNKLYLLFSKLGGPKIFLHGPDLARGPPYGQP